MEVENSSDEENIEIQSMSIKATNDSSYDFQNGFTVEDRLDGDKKRRSMQRNTEADETMDSMNSTIEALEPDVRFYNIPLKNGVIVLMDHPASFTVYQYVSIQVLSGSVSVLGYEINPQSQSLEVFSSEKTGLIEVKTVSFETIWKKKGNLIDLGNKFQSIADDEEIANTVLRNLGNYTVAVYVKRCAFPVNLQFLELYYPSALEFNLYKKRPNHLPYDVPWWLYVDDMRIRTPMRCPPPVRFEDEIDKLLAKITMHIRSAKLAGVDAPRIIICGPKNTGKSYLIRYLINKILNIYSAALYLDTDPGQTEFTPPGIVSLTKVTKPILSPSFCHLKNPILMLFAGSISPHSPDLYAKNISKLMQLYKKRFDDEPLFVNTMGWMEGLGLQCLENVITIVKPTLLIEIMNPEETSMFDYRDLLPHGSSYIHLPCCFGRRNPLLSAKDMRNFALLSYFGKCQSPYLGPVLLNEIRPYCICWDKIPVYLAYQKVQPFRMLEVISQSIIALCIVPESAILQSDIPQFPKTLEDDPDHEFLGYGLVRAVDELNHLLYIVTPLKMDELKKVNAIIHGNVMIPDAVFFKQTIYDTPLPYVYEREVEDTRNQDDVPDFSKVSVIPPKPGQGTSTSTSTPLGSVDAYRKAIPSRYKRKFQ